MYFAIQVLNKVIQGTNQTTKTILDLTGCGGGKSFENTPVGQCIRQRILLDYLINSP